MLQIQDCESDKVLQEAISVVDCDFLICKAYRVNKLDDDLVGTTLPSDFSFAASAQGLCDLVLLYYLTLLDLSSINLTNV